MPSSPSLFDRQTILQGTDGPPRRAKAAGPVMRFTGQRTLARFMRRAVKKRSSRFRISLSLSGRNLNTAFFHPRLQYRSQKENMLRRK